MTGELFLVFGLAISLSVLLVPITQIKKEYGIIGKSALSIILLTYAIKKSYPLFEYIKKLSNSEYETYLQILISCFSVALLTKIATDMLCDLGANNVGEKVEFAGKIAILLLCLPMFEKLFGLLEALI